jgi:hypothetical protein
VNFCRYNPRKGAFFAAFIIAVKAWLLPLTLLTLMLTLYLEQLSGLGSQFIVMEVLLKSLTLPSGKVTRAVSLGLQYVVTTGYPKLSLSPTTSLPLLNGKARDIILEFKLPLVPNN